MSEADPARGPTSEIAATEPFFSVVVPVYRQWHLVPRLVASLALQTLPRRLFEVILVDNGSPDMPEAPIPGVTVLRCAEPGSYAARNVGASAAKGAWLAFTDADCIAARQWLEALRAAASDPRERLLAGPVRMIATSSRPGPSEIYDLVKGIPQERYIRRGYAATANFAVPARVFRRLGGFDATRFSGGDAEFCRRAARSGVPVVLAPAAPVSHPTRTSWKEIATKTRRIKGGQIGMSPRWRHRSAMGALIPPAPAAWSFLTNRRHLLRHRLIACVVLFCLWGVEVEEAFRLKLGKRRERS